jgi:hypothetical protein
MLKSDDLFSNQKKNKFVPAQNIEMMTRRRTKPPARARTKSTFLPLAHSGWKREWQKAQDKLKEWPQWQRGSQLPISLLLGFTFSEAYCVQQEQKAGATARFAWHAE